MFDLINQGWIGSLIGFLGILVGIVLYMKSKTRPRPACLIKSIRLIGKDYQELPSEVKILFNNNEVPRLTSTKIWLWNCGKETLRGSQVVDDDPLRCVFNPDDKILSAHIAAATRKVNKFSIILHPDKRNEALLNFDFLDPNDGVRVELLHTSKNLYPAVIGTIRGIPKGLIQVMTVFPHDLERAFSRIIRYRAMIYLFGFLLGLTFFVIGLFPESWLTSLGEIFGPSNVFRFFMLCFGCFYVFMCLMALLLIKRRYPSSLDTDNEGNQVYT